ncbi:hypothetical protein AURDEDRAFT_169524 [Auricularia subglabra TFB-10046 SS5]|uniref:Uncharacterized protein n=1 Tax=Auricularia subglabra (strain TFB-10046 / SS5) TaxID=717982 RepID=J0WX96_AURST|nr:hypothetical protein AURDEDRAFT_169524 [Auricularia subglabra TFB-10046 SS5]
MSRKVPSLVTLPDRDAPMPWDILDCSWTLPDEPRHKPAPVIPGERTPRPSPTRATAALQTRALAPDLRLASAALLALHEGSPAPAAPINKSNIIAANAATSAPWPLSHMAPPAEKENVEPERRGRSRTTRRLYHSTAQPLRPQRPRVVAATFAAADSPGPSPSPSPVCTTRAEPRAGRPTDPKPLVADDDLSPLRLAMAEIDSPAEAPVRTLRRVAGGRLPMAALRARVPGTVNVSSPVSDADSCSADEEDWSHLLLGASASRRGGWGRRR